MLNVQNFILINEGNTGIAGAYYRMLHRDGSKRAMFHSFVNAFEPGSTFDSSLLSVSATFYLDRMDKLENVDATKNLIIKMFENWYKDKRRQNQNAYEKHVAFSIDLHGATGYVEENKAIIKEIKMDAIDTYFMNNATDADRYIRAVEMGIHKPVRNDKRHYTDFPGGSISHATYSQKRKELTERIKRTI